MFPFGRLTRVSGVMMAVVCLLGARGFGAFDPATTTFTKLTTTGNLVGGHPFIVSETMDGPTSDTH